MRKSGESFTMDYELIREDIVLHQLYLSKGKVGYESNNA